MTQFTSRLETSITFNRALEMLHYLRQGWPVENKFDRHIAHLFDSCDNDGDQRITAPEMMWILKELGASHIGRASQYHHAQHTLLDKMWADARKARKQPLVCKPESVHRLERTAIINATRNTLWRCACPSLDPSFSRCGGR